jgi:4-hydroxy-2-oxoheptanedioate aldolase
MQKWNKKDWLYGRDYVLGTFLQLYDTAGIEVLSRAGFDFVIIDHEHGTVNMETVKSLMITADANGIVPIVRVKQNNGPMVMEPLDIGAKGVQIPHICNSEDVKKAVSYAKYHPIGERGMNPYVRATGYDPGNFADYMEWSNENVMLILHVEGMEGINNIHEIISESGVDILFLGPWDLSQSLGIPGKVEDPAVIEKMKEAIESAKEKGVAIGTFADTPERARKWIDLGVKYMSISVDTKMLLDGARAVVTSVKGQRANQ